MSPSAQFPKWFTLRRVRTALMATTLLLMAWSLLCSITLAPTKADLLQYTTNTSPPPKSDASVQWSDFAYLQYVTNANYLCNSLMILDALHRSETKADRVMMYPEDWHVSEDNTTDDSTESKLLAKARDSYQVKLVPIQVQSFEKGDTTWRESFTKLLAFNQTQYKRVISLDSDAIVREVSRYPDLPNGPGRTNQFLRTAHGRAFPATIISGCNASSILARPAISIQPIGRNRAFCERMAPCTTIHEPQRLGF